MIGMILREYWRPLAIGAIIAVCWWRLSVIVNERDSALHEVYMLKLQASVQAKLAEKNESDGKKQRQEDAAQKTADIQTVAKYYYGMAKDEKVNSDKLRIDLANSLRSRNNSNTSSVHKDDAVQSSEGDGNAATIGRVEEQSAEFYREALKGCEDYLHTVKAAGAVCAADFNECRDYVIGEQGRIGISE